MFNTFHYRTQSSCVLSRTLSVVTLIAQIEDVIYLSKGEKGKQKNQKELLDMQGQSYLSFVFSEWVVVGILRSDEVSPPANLRPPAPPDNTLPILQSTNIACTHLPWPCFPQFPKDLIVAISPPLCPISQDFFGNFLTNCRWEIFSDGQLWQSVALWAGLWKYPSSMSLWNFLHRSRSKTRNMPKNVGLAGIATSMCLR